MSKVAVIVKLTAAPGKGQEVVDAFNDLYQGPLDAEEGTVLHIIHRGKSDPDAVYFYEMYADDAAMQAHNSGAALRAVFPKLAGLLSGAPEVTALEAANAKGVAV